MIVIVLVVTVAAEMCITHRTTRAFLRSGRFPHTSNDNNGDQDNENSGPHVSSALSGGMRAHHVHASEHTSRKHLHTVTRIGLKTKEQTTGCEALALLPSSGTAPLENRVAGHGGTGA